MRINGQHVREHHGVQPTGCMVIEPQPSLGIHFKAFPGRPANLAWPYPELCTCKAVVFYHWGCKPYTSSCSPFEQGTSNPTRDLSVPTAISQYAVILPPSSARPSTEPTVTSPDHLRVFKALSVCPVPGVLLHYHLRLLSPVTAYCHADVYSATQIFDSTSVPSCGNIAPTSHSASVLASPVT